MALTSGRRTKRTSSGGLLCVASSLLSGGADSLAGGFRSSFFLLKALADEILEGWELKVFPLGRNGVGALRQGLASPVKTGAAVSTGNGNSHCALRSIRRRREGGEERCKGHLAANAALKIPFSHPKSQS